MECNISRRHFLLNLPFVLNLKFKKSIIVEVHEKTKNYTFIFEETKLEEIPFKIINKFPHSFMLEIKFSENEKYLFKKIFWQVPLLEDFNLWTRQKWIKNKKNYDDENIDLIICSI